MLGGVNWLDVCSAPVSHGGATIGPHEKGGTDLSNGAVIVTRPSTPRPQRRTAPYHLRQEIPEVRPRHHERPFPATGCLPTQSCGLAPSFSSFLLSGFVSQVSIKKSRHCRAPRRARGRSWFTAGLCRIFFGHDFSTMELPVVRLCRENILTPTPRLEKAAQ